MDDGTEPTTPWHVWEDTSGSWSAPRAAVPTPGLGLVRGVLALGSFSAWMVVDQEGKVRQIRQGAGSIPTVLSVGQSLYDYLDDASAEGLRRRLARAFTGAAFSSLLVFQAGPRQRSHFEVHHVPRFDSHGAVEEVALLVHEVSARQQREVERQVLREALDATDAAVVVCEADAELTVVFANAAFLGVSAFKDVVGSPMALDERWSDPEGDEPLQCFRDARRGARQGRLVCSDGSGEEWEIHVAPLVALDGTLRLVGVLRDVSHQRRLEERVRRAAQLDALGQLAGSAAHDFNNLLGAMRVELGQLAAAISGEKAVEANLVTLDQCVQQSRALLARLVAMARPTAPEPRPLELDEAIRGQHRLLASSCGEHVELRLEAEAGLYVLGDSALLDVVWLNLVRNAAEAMPDGGTIRIRVCREGSLALVQVEDEGIGMSEATRAQAFEPFFSTKGTHGTGLGLSSARRIVEDHGGTLELESRPERGTVATVRLPLVDSFRDPDAAMPKAPGAARASAPQHILVVDDQDGLRRGLARGLVRAGYRVTEARDGVEAAALLANLPDVDVVLTDVVMPRMGGVELVEAIQRDRPDVRVLMMTGYSDPTFGPLPRGVTVLNKPFQVSDLLGRLSALVDEHD